MSHDYENQQALNDELASAIARELADLRPHLCAGDRVTIAHRVDADRAAMPAHTCTLLKTTLAGLVIEDHHGVTFYPWSSVWQVERVARPTT